MKISGDKNYVYVKDLKIQSINRKERKKNQSFLVGNKLSSINS